MPKVDLETVKAEMAAADRALREKQGRFGATLVELALAGELDAEHARELATVLAGGGHESTRLAALVAAKGRLNDVITALVAATAARPVADVEWRDAESTTYVVDCDWFSPMTCPVVLVRHRNLRLRDYPEIRFPRKTDPEEWFNPERRVSVVR